MHVSVYLVRAPGGSILIDSGSFYHRESLSRRIGEATGDQGPQALVLSHSDYPHSANIPSFRDSWGDFEIVASVASPEIQGLPYARRARIGESLDVLGRRFTFIDPPLADRSHTTWIYDEEARTLFVADGFGTLHAPGNCDDIPIGHGLCGGWGNFCLNNGTYDYCAVECRGAGDCPNGSTCAPITYDKPDGCPGADPQIGMACVSACREG